MTYRVDWTDAAREEMVALLKVAPEEASYLMAALEEIDQQPHDPFDLLGVYKKAEYEDFSCGFFVEAYERSQVRIWSLKVFIPQPGKKYPISVRALFAPSHSRRKYVVLAVRTRHKDICYGTKDSRYDAIIQDYKRFSCDS